MQEYFSYKNLSVAYTKQGRGNAVVLIHGFGEDGNIWHYQVIELQKYYIVIVIDLPGTGKSKINDWILLNDKKEKEKVIEYLSSIEFYADCVFELLEHLSIKKCTILGHSMGGYIALAFAEKYANFLNGFGLIHSTAYADSDEKKINRQRGIELMEQYGAYAFLKTTIPNLFSSIYKTTNPENIDALIEFGKNFEVLALQNYYRAMMNRFDRTSVLKSSNMPILLIIGTEDVAVPLKDSLQQSHMAKSSYIHILENVGHMGMIEEPDKVNNYLLSFLTNL